MSAQHGEQVDALVIGKPLIDDEAGEAVARGHKGDRRPAGSAVFDPEAARIGHEGQGFQHIRIVVDDQEGRSVVGLGGGHGGLCSARTGADG